MAKVNSHAERFPGGVPLHGGDMFKWEKVGQELIGTFISVKKFKKGHIGAMETENGRISFSAPTVLADILDGISAGAKIAIIYAKDKPNPKKDPATGKPLNPTKFFEVYQLPESEDE